MWLVRALEVEEAYYANLLLVPSWFSALKFVKIYSYHQYYRFHLSLHWLQDSVPMYIQYFILESEVIDHNFHTFNIFFEHGKIHYWTPKRLRPADCYSYFENSHVLFGNSHSNNNLVELDTKTKEEDDQTVLLEGGLTKSASFKQPVASIKSNLIRLVKQVDWVSFAVPYIIVWLPSLHVLTSLNVDF